jgi:hypothetical protein
LLMPSDSLMRSDLLIASIKFMLLILDGTMRYLIVG